MGVAEFRGRFGSLAGSNQGPESGFVVTTEKRGLQLLDLSVNDFVRWCMHAPCSLRVPRCATLLGAWSLFSVFCSVSTKVFTSVKSQTDKKNHAEKDKGLFP